MPGTLSRAVNKATDATLLQDNWEYVLNVCDMVLEDPEDGAKKVIQLISDRLQTRDANVQLRTLSLLTSVAENCGSRVKQEIATKSFTTILLSKLRDPTVHRDIKVKLVQVIHQLSQSFSNDPSLKPIQTAYNEVRSDFSQYFPPDKPQKQSMSSRERQQEEEDLKAAIALSLKDSAQQQPTQSVQQQIQQAQPAQPPVQQQQLQQQQQQEPQPHSFSRVRALYDSFSEDPADLKFRKGDIITVFERVYKDWGKGSLRGVVGLFPFNYVTPLYDPTPEELAKEAELENQILSKSRQVEKLLALLQNVESSEDGFRLTNSDEFRQLYQDIALIKPELATLIDKYRQRKDDLMDLHKKVKEASVVYEDLTDPMKYQYHSQYPYYPPQPQQEQQPQAVPPQPQPQPQAQENPPSLQHSSTFDRKFPPVNQFQPPSLQSIQSPSQPSAPQPQYYQPQQRQQQSTGSIPPIPQTGTYPQQSQQETGGHAPYPQY